MIKGFLLFTWYPLKFCKITLCNQTWTYLKFNNKNRIYEFILLIYKSSKKKSNHILWRFGYICWCVLKTLDHVFNHILLLWAFFPFLFFCSFFFCFDILGKRPRWGMSPIYYRRMSRLVTRLVACLSWALITCPILLLIILGFYRRLWRSSKKLLTFVTIGFFIFGTLGVNMFLIPFLLSIQQEYHWSKRKMWQKKITLKRKKRHLQTAYLIKTKNFLLKVYKKKLKN